MTLGITVLSTKCGYAECRVFYSGMLSVAFIIVMLNVIMLIVVKLSVVNLSIIILSVIKASVVAPRTGLDWARPMFFPLS